MNKESSATQRQPHSPVEHLRGTTARLFQKLQSAHVKRESSAIQRQPHSPVEHLQGTTARRFFFQFKLFLSSEIQSAHMKTESSATQCQPPNASHTVQHLRVTKAAHDYLTLCAWRAQVRTLALLCFTREIHPDFTATVHGAMTSQFVLRHK
jgi:hypothetical protein